MVFFKKAIACAASAALALCGLPAAAFAVESESGTVVSGSWTLNYTIEDGAAIITGGTGSGALVIPATAGGKTVTTIGKQAFAQNSSITSLSLPEGLMYIEQEAFWTSSVQSVTFPTTLEYIKQRGFCYCKSLKSIDFRTGSTPEFFGESCFQYDDQIEEIVIPPMDGSAYKSIWSDCRLGTASFKSCKKLAKVTFLAGSESCLSGYMNSSGSYTFTDIAANPIFLYYAPGPASHVSELSNNTGKAYLAVNFYSSKEAAEADKTYTHYDSQALVPMSTNRVQLFTGALNDTLYSGTVPAAPEGKVWAGEPTSARNGIAVVLGGSDYNWTTVTNCMKAFPVDPEDVEFASVRSYIVDAYNTVSGFNAIHSNDHYFRLRANGTVDVSSFYVTASDGSVLPESAYSLEFIQVVTVGATATNQTTTYKELDSPSQINAEGEYRVRARGVGKYKDVCTQYVQFYVRRYDATLVSYINENANVASGNVIHDAMASLNKGKARFVTVSDVNNWQACLVSMGLAGAGEGLALFTDGSSTASSMFLSLSGSAIDTVSYVGASSGEIGTSVTGRVGEIIGEDGTFNRMYDSDPAALALRVYENVKKYGQRADEPYQWGTTAVVMGSQVNSDLLACAQYIYKAQAPVFFLEADGSLGSATADALKDGGFERVVIVGGTDSVDEAAQSAIADVIGFEPKRIMGEDGNILEKSRQLAKACGEDFGNENEGALYANDIVVASASEASTILASAEYAAITSRTLYVCASSANEKELEQQFIDNTLDELDRLCFVGDFSRISPSIKSDFSSLWTTGSVAAVGKGDTIEVDGLLFTLGTSNRVSFSGTLVGAKTVLSIPASVSFQGVKCSVTSVSANACNGNKKITKVTLPSAISSIGTGAFSNCTALSSVQIGSKSITSIPASCFKGCKALKSLVVKSSKIKKVGKAAFSSTPSSITVKVPKAKMSAYKKLFVSAGLSKKAKVKAA